MTPTTRMHVLRRSREIVNDILTEQEKQEYQIISQLDEVIAGISKRLEEAQKKDSQAKLTELFNDLNMTGACDVSYSS